MHPPTITNRQSPRPPAPAGWRWVWLATAASLVTLLVTALLAGAALWLQASNENPIMVVRLLVASATTATAVASSVVVVVSQQSFTGRPTIAVAVVTLASLLRWEVEAPIVVGAVGGRVLHRRWWA